VEQGFRGALRHACVTTLACKPVRALQGRPAHQERLVRLYLLEMVREAHPTQVPTIIKMKE
jgi:hypothetical protein